MQMVSLQEVQWWPMQVVKKVLERDLERYFSAECKRLGIESLKIMPRFSVGWPDRLIILNDQKVLWIELKTLTGVVSPRQQKIHEMLKARGHHVCIIRTKEEIKYALAAASLSAKRG